MNDCIFAVNVKGPLIVLGVATETLIFSLVKDYLTYIFLKFALKMVTVNLFSH
jgi:hypothetical protein